MKKLLILIFLILNIRLMLYPITNHPTDSVINVIQSKPVTYPIRFVFMGDNRNSDSIPPGLMGDGDSTFSALRNVIDNIYPSPYFAINNGDFCLDGYRYEYYKYVAMIDSSVVPWLSIRGNHELYADEGPFLYDSIFGDTDFVFDYGNARFIMMSDCQQHPFSDWNAIDYLFTYEQLDWLDSLLSDAYIQNKYPFVFAHVPPYIPGHNTTYCLGYENYYPQPNYELSHTELFTNKLTDYNVLLAGFGHQHFYDRYTYNNVHYIVSGGGGGPLVPPLQSAPYGGSFFHFILFELYEDGTLKGYIYKKGQSNPDPDYNFTYYTGIKDNNILASNDIIIDIINRNDIFYIYSNKLMENIKIIGINGQTILERKLNSRSYQFSIPRNRVYFYIIKTKSSIRKGKIINLK